MPNEGSAATGFAGQAYLRHLLSVTNSTRRLTRLAASNADSWCEKGAESINLCVAQQVVYQGTVNSSVVRAAEVFRPAVSRTCPALVVVHNHPSGDPTPSLFIWRIGASPLRDADWPARCWQAHLAPAED